MATTSVLTGYHSKPIKILNSIVYLSLSISLKEEEIFKQVNGFVKDSKGTTSNVKELCKTVTGSNITFHIGKVDLLSLYRCEKIEAEALILFSFNKQEICKNDRKMYLNFDNSRICSNPTCMLSRNTNVVEAEANIKQLPLPEQLAHFLKSKENRENILYAKIVQVTLGPKKIRDFF